MNKNWLFNIGLGIAATGVFILLLFLWMNWFTNHNVAIQVPNITGMNMQEAIEKLDDEGFLYIVGRKKELIVTAGGKNVAPAVLEDRLRAHPLVSQCIVVGDNQPFIAALVTIDQDALKGWVANNKKDGASINELINDPDLIAVVQTAVDEANKAVSKAESIRKFTILPVDFTIAGGHLTAKLSVKRHVVAKEFAQEIDALFTK